MAGKKVSDLVEESPNTVAAFGTFVGSLSRTTLVSSADILALDTVPKSLIPAPGVGKCIVLYDWAIVYDYGTVEYTGDTVKIWLGDDSILARPGGIFQPVQDAVAFGKGQSNEDGTLVWRSLVENVPIYLKATSALTDGDGTAIVYVNYKIVDLP